MAIILITGGSGLIGRALTAALLAEGHEVRHLTRAYKKVGPVRSYLWDVRAGKVEPAAMEGVDHLIHLAGAGIADKRWTKTRVEELIDSRAASARLLLRVAQEQGTMPKTFVSAAGIGYYGAVTSDRVYVESEAPGSDPIARISVEWEDVVVDEWGMHCRVVKLRTPLVLARGGGGLPQLAAPIRWGVGSPLGTGRQWVPWVHIADLVNAYMFALGDERLQGAYNVVSGSATNADLMRTAAKVLRRPFLLPRVPGIVLKALFGEMADILLEGSRASSARLLSTGFRFKHAVLEEALSDLLVKH